MAHPVIDVNLGPNLPQRLLFEKHVAFLKSLEKSDNPMQDHMKLSAIYWTLTALDLMQKLDIVDKDEILRFVRSCHNPDGGFAPAPGHDSHMLSTLSGIQVLTMYNELRPIDKENALRFISKLQNSDGSFNGDKWGEVDSRFSFCAIASLSLLGVIPPDPNHVLQPAEGVDLQMAVDFLVRCQNRDGGFGTRPGSESHAGQAYCVIGALSLLRRLRRLDIGKAAWWLAERQLPSGGLNGRPGKQPDVCYSWWVLASLTILGCLKWINPTELTKFIFASQDSETGGISDRPGNCADPFHTLFGLAGLSLLSRLNNTALSLPSGPMGSNGAANQNGDTNELSVVAFALRDINPVLCMPQYVVDRLHLLVQTI